MEAKGTQVLTITLNPAVDVIGSVKEFQAGRLNRIQSGIRKPGGKGINIASALADFGHGVAVSGFLGKEDAALFEQFFRPKNIADHMVRIDGATRSCIKIFDPSNSETTEINFPGLQVPDPAALLRHIETISAPWVALAGSLLPGIDAGFYQWLINELHQRGRKVLLDTSGAPLRLGLDQHPEIIKPNLHELQELVGKPLFEPSEIARAVQGLVHGLAVVSMAEKGACFVTRDWAVVARPPFSLDHPAVGAGDAMAAGILSAVLDGLEPEALAKRAVAFSVDWINSNGSCSAEAIERIATEVQIERLA